MTGGKIEGMLTESADVSVFKGIPFAAPPVGELRWKKPQPVIPWEGVMMADRYKKICPQVLTRPIESYPERYRSLYTEHDEDCLYLNVWAPTETIGKPDAKLPVMFWIHGGAYKTGSGITMSTDGVAWAKHGVILVTINYRLNILGFLDHPELTKEQGSSGNYGLYDQVAALKWTYENIAKFGGDPDNITIAGQSAGAGSVKSLTISPLAKPYIAKAIIESGGGLSENPQARRPVMTQANYDERGERYMKSGGFDNLKKMRAASYSDMISNCTETFSGSPHPDGVILTEGFDQAAVDGTIADIPFLIGYNDADLAGMVGEPVHRFCRARSELSKKPVYEYEFRRTPGKSGGCPHSGELIYVFKTLDRRDNGDVPQVDYDLSEQVVTWWTDFCKGKAPWTAFTSGNPYLKIIDVE